MVLEEAIPCGGLTGESASCFSFLFGAFCSADESLQPPSLHNASPSLFSYVNSCCGIYGPSLSMMASAQDVLFIAM